MEKLLAKVQKNLNWRQDLKKVCRRNKVSTVIASSLNPIKIRSLYQRFKKIYSSSDKNKYKSWVQNQLRTLYWILIAISFLEQKLIADFVKPFLYRIRISFPQLIRFSGPRRGSYQNMRLSDLLTKKKTQNKGWSSQQNNFLLQVMKKNQNNNKWNNIARQLFEQSNGVYFRSGKQCRQRWNNHLDPSKYHGDWSEAQDLVILKYIYFGGKKWSQIARILVKRTEHMVKNRFKSIVIKYKKELGKNANQNAIVEYAIQNSKQQIGSEQLMQLKQLQNYYIQKNLSLRNRSNLIQKPQEQLPQIKSSANLKDLLPVIKEHDSQSQHQFRKKIQMQEEELDPVSAFNKGIEDQIIKQITQCKKDQPQNCGSFNDLQMINSPAMWHLRSHNSLNTPGLFNFSPTSPLLNTFSQFQKCMDYKWIYDDFNRSTKQ